MVDPVYRKTDAGHDEIRTRARKLDHKLRALLLMVNGERRGQDLLAQVAGMGMGPGAMDMLVAQGLVESVPETAASVAVPEAPARPSATSADTNLFSVYAMRHAPADGPTAIPGPTTPTQPTHSAAEIDAFQRLYHFYTEVIGQHLGLRGYMLQVKVEKAQDLPALLALREPLHAALLKAKGEITAHAILRELDTIAQHVPVAAG
ncbi:hypothetical protein [Cupriavidus oxalaticus]|jgi:hypothetical protein|uniref:Proline-rich protein n=1 Tax=Cupriavidus oxalaticus TaxID=96344 RepID=A0A375G3I1_9BURK|nr:hypothetical protein [Cupriavidus oxalaticus]QEZ46746.1 hypothetical protein D2917_21305 [Cupriavidus oxalaticus]QRQ88927.1 hypothetical protein JTE91_20585 [Cupriavidus oxalaticus]QRQ92747.1 hypothetical protein JTE92_21675 [Cupriavidus oxalaticus]WQD81352.1 hypothetical protein U0036_09405 [Cupriavidus oxalaticus]SPC12648.1 conserved hypothetical protein [Cupriavidus oxalaticus]